MLNVDQMREIVSRCEFPGYTLGVYGSGDLVQAYLQGSYEDPDVDSGEPSLQKTRKWILSPHMTASELVQTAFKCCLTSMEHRVREGFTYRGERVFGPHFDVEGLYELAKLKREDRRMEMPV